ncbi:hypothetical protein [Undibacterium sp. Tian12W]|uniref:hypothetical protein n=1 Tax=Undibacterium sp. Tian12W TaxID=3413054 RepID=UPI003BF180AB
MKLINKVATFGALSVAGVQAAFAAGATPVDLTPLTSQFDPAPVTTGIMSMGSGLMTISVVALGVLFILKMAKRAP